VEADRGAESVTLEGIVLAVVPPSGVIYRCPSCQRTVHQGMCRTHGSVAGTADLRLRLSLDDGTGAATVNLERIDAERLTGVSLAAALAMLRAQPDPSLLEERLFESVFGRRLRVRGRASVDDFGATVYPDLVESVAPPVADVAGLRARLTGRP
jgi:replication factor A1